MDTGGEAQLRRSAAAARLGRRLGGERWLLVLARLLLRLRIEGASHIPARGACLFPYNHASTPADLILNVAIRRRRPDAAAFSMQGWQGENPLAQFLQRVGRGDLQERLLYAYKGRGLSAGELVRAARLLQGGGAIALAAEGELTWDGRLQHPLMPGTAWLALRCGAPVVPVVSIGGYDLQPRWDMERLRLTGRLIIRAGPPLTLGDAPMARIPDAALADANQRVWEAMAALLPPGQAAAAG